MELNEEVEQVIKFSREYAVRHEQEFLTLESLMLGILKCNEGIKIMSLFKVNIDVFASKLEEYMEKNVSKRRDPKDEPQAAIDFQRMLSQAATYAASSTPKRSIAIADMLVSMYNFESSFSAAYLNHVGVEKMALIRYLAHGEKPEKVASGENAGLENEGAPQKSFLDKYAINLNKQAEDKKIDPLIGRDMEVSKVINILCQRRKSNPLLVGDAGVGKTALAEGMASRINEGKVPSMLKNAKVYSVDMAAMLAGAKYRGDFEERLKGVIQEASERDDVVLFIDEIHTLVGAGAGSGGAMDASNIMKPALAGKKLRVIGATTYDEYRKHFEKDHALRRRFQKVDIGEPSPDDCIKVLNGLRKTYEDFHHTTFAEGALEAAVRLSVRYLPALRLPDKAIDVIDNAGTAAKLRADSKGEVVSVVTEEDIATAVGALSGISVGDVKEDERHRLKRLPENMQKEIFGQEEAANTLISAIKNARSGLSEGSKPWGSFVFSGPSGVGKTELAKVLSNVLDKELLRFDMSEYMEAHAVARLIGAPPGYIGHDKGGVLTEAINQKPDVVLLLDEIEKAHPDIYNILLQVMDHGSLTDSNGRKIDFRNVVIIMTTNAGAEASEARGMGFGDPSRNADKREEAIKKLFTPEFRNRLDAIVQFKNLDSPQVIMKIVGKELNKVSQRLMNKNISLVFTEETRRYVAENGVDTKNKMGARPLQRFIKDQIFPLLSDEILFGRLEMGGEAVIEMKEGLPVVNILSSFKEKFNKEDMKPEAVTVDEVIPLRPTIKP